MFRSFAVAALMFALLGINSVKADTSAPYVDQSCGTLERVINYLEQKNGIPLAVEETFEGDIARNFIVSLVNHMFPHNEKALKAVPEFDKIYILYSPAGPSNKAVILMKDGCQTGGKIIAPEQLAEIERSAKIK